MTRFAMKTKIHGYTDTRIHDNFNFDRTFLSSRLITVPQKISYLARKYFTLATNNSKINFLGNSFAYDNRFTPVLLQGYPIEIEILDNAVDLNNIETVLDVGANIGFYSWFARRWSSVRQVVMFERLRELQAHYANDSKKRDFRLRGGAGSVVAQEAYLSTGTHDFSH